MTRVRGTRAALRMARRDALRHKARSALIVVMVAIPVLALSGADVLARTMQLDVGERLMRTMGQADAELTLIGGKVSQTANGGGWSNEGEMVRYGSVAYVDLRRRVEAALPPGTRLVDDIRATAPAGANRLLAQDVEVRGIDLRDPVTAGILRVTSGRAPANVHEAALTPRLAQRIRVSVGGTVVVGHRALRVVGIVHDPQAVSEEGVALLPAALPADNDTLQASVLADTPGPVTWPDVLRLNAIGAVVASRDVAEHPPPGVPSADESTLASQARTLGIATVAVGLAVLEVGLLAGAAFAVGVRRQRRDLALVAAVGGDERHVRRFVLAGGVVLGAAGAVLGVIGGVAAARAALPLAVRMADADPGHFDPRALELLAIAVLGLVTGVAAAFLPARAAAREDVVAALTGRRGVVATRRRVPVIGLVMIVLGAVAAAYAAHPPARFSLVLVGAVVAEVGFVVCAPAIVGAVGRLARRMPLTMRLALRDASRHRSRTGPAVAAVLAAVAGSVAVSAWVTSTIAQQRQQYQPILRIGQTAVALQSVPDGAERAAVETAIRRDLPATGLLLLSTADCRSDGCTPFLLEPELATCSGDGACGTTTTSPSIAVGDASTLDAILGRHDAGAAAALDRGEVVVFASGVQARGRAVVVAEPTGAAGPREVDRHPLPAYLADSGNDGAAVGGMVSPATAASLQMTPQPWGYLVSTSRLPTVAEEDAAQADVGHYAADVMVERGYHPERWNYGLVALAGAAALVTLVATAVATALSASDSRPDLVTLAAVGAGPRLRRRLAAAQAATVAVLGSALGAVAGLIPAWAIVHAHGQMPFAPPWQTVGIVVVGVPLLAAAATGILTRSRLPSERRAT